VFGYSWAEKDLLNHHVLEFLRHLQNKGSAPLSAETLDALNKTTLKASIAEWTRRQQAAFEGKAEAKADASHAKSNASFFSTGLKTTGEYMRYGGQVLNVIQNAYDVNPPNPFELWCWQETVNRLVQDLFSTAFILGITACFVSVPPVAIAALLVSPMLLVLGLGLSSLGDYLEEPAAEASAAAAPGC